MSGAGYSNGAGIGPAGDDPVAALSAGPSEDGTPRALDYNEGVFAFDAETGAYASISPVEQRLRLALLNKLGAVPAAPDQGFDWTTPFQWGERLTADVTDRLRDAVTRAGLVVGVDYQEVSIEVRGVRPAGRVSWIYMVTDIRTGVQVELSNG